MSLNSVQYRFLNKLGIRFLKVGNIPNVNGI